MNESTSTATATRPNSNATQVATRKELVATPLNQPTFDEVVLPHLPAARRLARWLMRSREDADDVVQESALRALLYFHTFTGGSARAWFLRIVRNTSYLRHSQPHARRMTHLEDPDNEVTTTGLDPEALLLQSIAADCVEDAMSDLSARSRELLRRRELEGLSYRELADSMEMPLGTVMSGLSRARRAMKDALMKRMVSGEGGPCFSMRPAASVGVPE
jgi:RNA polymerase sigma-70 factor (ECF subfamily)